ncbi:RNA polymerase sigma-70 factor (ECF subfamily) [Salinibacter ruber]|jgi:RNA polymerase sigma-70 factor (ECF subfamily)|nr:sigma-70 family RNA polymerase sigma factor [Salinibacter ruber]MBB4061860.1 RNA polymerase sigma-70 factor (ECF subfamily) [Salinibacter ruber]MBB4068293.1 RNA polymerase sigma-70 factor (ECF subfamily) [Salinibacter ruber]MBB4088741.1 RNA polymerase sigma-70 factor (ECF subfamily) [Salinibacter ruber]MCS3612882.1 RNA polymerase sigma-70 factor (ECF subfamily) [Salinibacter ruber]MCS3613744.1 RNA polymerase sigma-70 factor (ECF subfamily) [Salinibacter ruber]
MQPTDEELVSAYLDESDEQAFRQLVERHQDRIFGYLMGMVKDRAVANDLFQETFERVIKAMHGERGSYDRQGQWLSWVMSIARNAAIDHTRKQKKWTDVPQDEDDGRSFWDTLEDDSPYADEQLHRAEQREWLDEHIEQLAPEQKEVLLLRQETDLTFREIAELQDVSINTALGRMRYALKNLRKMMEASDETALVGTIDT